MKPSVVDDLNAIREETVWLTNHIDTYRRAHAEQQRAGHRTQSNAVGTTGNYDHTPLRYTQQGDLAPHDQHDHHLTTVLTEIAISLRRARTELETTRRRIGEIINTTKRPADPQPRKCANPHCQTTFTMIGRDAPQDADGRCDACRQHFKRKGYERWTPTANLPRVDPKSGEPVRNTHHTP